MAAEAATLSADAPTEVREAATPVKAPELKEAAGTAKAEKPSGKPKKEKKAKKGAAAEEGDGDGAPSVAAHPRAARAVGRAKGWGALAGFLVAGYMSLPTAPIVEAGLRALAAGVVCYVAAWAAAVFAWRRLVMLEIKAREQQLIAAAEAARAPRAPGGVAGSAERTRAS